MHNFIIIADAPVIRDLLCGEQQHNEHCKGWRWHLYTQDNDKRFANVMDEMRKMHAERRAQIDALRSEAEFLEAAE